MKTSLSLSDIKHIPFIRENWRNNYLNWLLKNLESTIGRVKEQALSLVESYPDGALKCNFSFKLGWDDIRTYGDVRNFSAIKSTFSEKIDALLDALLLIY